MQTPPHSPMMPSTPVLDGAVIRLVPDETSTVCDSPLVG